MENVNKRGNALVGVLVAILIIAAVLFGMFLANYLADKKENNNPNTEEPTQEEKKEQNKNEEEKQEEQKEEQKQDIDEESKISDISLESFNIIGIDNKEYKIKIRKETTQNYEKKYYEVYNNQNQKLTYEFDGRTYSEFIVYLTGAGYGYIDETREQEAFYGYGDNSIILTKIVGNKIYSIIGNRKPDNNKVYEYEITINNNEFEFKQLKDYSNIIRPTGMVR